MILKHEWFNSAWALTNFVNSKNIKKEDIQVIFYNEETSKYTIFYWK